MHPRIFATLSPTRLFFRCALPAMIGMAVSACYTIADGVFVGRFIGRDALAAVNLVMPLELIASALADMLAVGASVRVAVLLGQGDRENANRTFTFCLKAVFLLSVALGALGLLCAGPALAYMGAEGAARAYGEEYIRVYALFAPLTLLFFATDNYLRLCGRETYSMVVNIVASLLNIALDYLLIVVWGQGIWSAALASCISMALGTALSLLPFLRKQLALRFARGRIPLGQFLRLVANGSSELLSSAAASVLSVALNVVLLALGGTTAVAAISIVLYVDSLVGMLIFGMVSALQPALSYCHGAGLDRRVAALQRRIMAAGAGLSLAALVLMRCFGGAIAPLFVEPGDDALLAMCLRAMEFYGLSYLVSWIDGCLSGYLTALERPWRSLLVSLLGTLVFPCLCLAWLAPARGLDGVWLMPLAAGVLSALVAIPAAATVRRRRRQAR